MFCLSSGMKLETLKPEKRKGMKKRIILMTFVTMAMIVFMCLPSISFGQILPDPGNPDGSPAPIDGGVSILIAAGIGYSVKKVRDYRKKKQVQIIESRNV